MIGLTDIQKRHEQYHAAFEAESEEEVSVATGDEVSVQAEVDGWYQVRQWLIS